MKGFKHPATLIASLALFVALGGGAALASGLISGTKIVNHSIPEKKLTAAAIKALQGQQGPAGAQGPTGATGPKGDQGPIGPSYAYSAFDENAVAVAVTPTTVESLTLGAGSYVVMAKTSVFATSALNADCRLTDSQAGNIDDAIINQGAAGEVPLGLVAPLTSGGSIVSIKCSSSSTGAVASETHLVAIKVGSVSGS